MREAAFNYILVAIEELAKGQPFVVQLHMADGSDLFGQVEEKYTIGDYVTFRMLPTIPTSPAWVTSEAVLYITGPVFKW